MPLKGREDGAWTCEGAHLGDPDGSKGRKLVEGIVHLHLHLAAIHHKHDIIDGDGRLCNAGGQHHLQPNAQGIQGM